jgi:hypothetical protein
MNDYLRIDVSSLQGKLDALKATLSTGQYQMVLYRALKRTAEQVKTATAREVRQDYHIAYGAVLKTIKNPVVSKLANGVNAYLNISKAREKIGGGGFSYVSRGGLAAKIVKTGNSRLPTKGARPHFAVKKKKQVFVRRATAGKTWITTQKTKAGTVYHVAKQPISPGVGIGIPQMPITRSAGKIQNFAILKLGERLEHEHDVIMRKIV